ncbi:MAG: 6-chlorohydroxyquinol-1,2-dioxygenase [Pseudomonadales bacterium]|jgi:catechol 1,2-dioxygenase|nr:6-chlorohydroxyquinol-1,2-dioxygenase [Pseudomonadales bacterium]
MMIRTPEDVTRCVLEVMEKTADPRLREILVALITHLHGFLREVKLTEVEYRAATALLAQLGQQTTDTHNEVVLIGGSLGVSQLICLMNNGDLGAHETSQNLLGPFWRLHQPPAENGSSIVRSATPGPELDARLTVLGTDGAPIVDAEVDVWHSSPVGYYENQDPDQAFMNLRGKFKTDAKGQIRFRSVKPGPYPIPTNGVVGQLLQAQGRHPYRPAHVHALVYKEGYKTLTSQIYVRDDPYCDTDVQFGITEALTADYVLHDTPNATFPDMARPWYSLDFTLILEAGQAQLPRPPIK